MNSVLINEENFERARKEIRKNKGREIIFTSYNDETAKKVLEKEDISVLLIKQKNRKDRLKQRSSGLDSVMSKIAKKKRVVIGIDYDEIVNSRGKEKSEILSRIKQNISLCNKEKVKMKFISEKDINRYEVSALGLVLGMSTLLVKDL